MLITEIMNHCDLKFKIVTCTTDRMFPSSCSSPGYTERQICRFVDAIGVAHLPEWPVSAQACTEDWSDTFPTEGFPQTLKIK